MINLELFSTLPLEKWIDQELKVAAEGGVPIIASVVADPEPSNTAKVAKKVEVPIIGCGGIASANDALEFIMAGASAVEVGTTQFVNPRALLDVVDGIEDFMRRQGVKDISELIGAVR